MNLYEKKGVSWFIRYEYKERTFTWMPHQKTISVGVCNPLSRCSAYLLRMSSHREGILILFVSHETFAVGRKVAPAPNLEFSEIRCRYNPLLKYNLSCR